jgi:glycosyltransferase involved in cell wall biosynthesis
VVRTELEMIDAVGRLLSDENLRRSMGAAARRASEQYDWDVVARMWECLFHEVAARRQAGAATDLDSLAGGVGAHSV